MDQDGRRPFELVYHGQFDDSRPSNNTPVTGRCVIHMLLYYRLSVFYISKNLTCYIRIFRRDLSLAIDLVLSCQPIPTNQKPRYTQIPLHFSLIFRFTMSPVFDNQLRILHLVLLKALVAA